MIGDPYLYRSLAAVDPDFRETFKVKADFNFEVDRTQENLTAFACLSVITAIVRDCGISTAKR
jgi:hypothetical protein